MTMQSRFVAVFVLACTWQAQAQDSTIGKVVSMLSDLQAKIIKEGEVVQAEYAQFTEWCEDRSRNLGFEIKTGNSEMESLKASIAEEIATTGSLQTKVEELVASIATNEADLKAAVEIREKEAADFTAEDKELQEIINMLVRATNILERQMKGGASMMQLKNAGSLAQVFSVMVQSSLISSSDASKLTGFLQARDTNDDEAPGAPASSVYASQSGGIVETLQELTDKAESQLSDARQKEVAATHNFEMLKQSLEDELKFSNKDLDASKKGIAASAEKKSTASGDLGVTSKELASDTDTKENLHHTCMTRASAFQAETQSRGEELKALASAKKIIGESTGVSFGQVSFLQLARSKLNSGADLASFEAVRFVRDLARKQQSSALTQLASRMASAMHSSDPFEKVKGLISDMISKLESAAGADATKKAYCDKELAETNVKKADKSDEIEKLSTKIEQMGAKSAQLKEEVASLQDELAKLAKGQAEMSTLRHNENTAYGENKAVLEKGISGVKMALTILNQYYAKEDKSHDAAQGASSGIIGLLEVVEADFSKNLAEVEADEDLAARECEQLTKQNEIEKMMKDQDVKYKIKEAKELDKTSAELSSDRSGVQAELDAVLEYLSRIESECIAKAEAYETRVARRTAEIAGLKQALQILESETALIQKQTLHRALRGSQ